MATITFDVVEFRLLFPSYASEVDYPTPLLQANWDIATCYISDQVGCYLSEACRKYALNLMTAHITAIGDIVNGGGDLTVEDSSSIDKISVSVVPPSTPDAYKWWLASTPYGKSLSALLSVKGAGGLYVSGLPETSAFRRVGGIFV